FEVEENRGAAGADFADYFRAVTDEQLLAHLERADDRRELLDQFQCGLGRGHVERGDYRIAHERKIKRRSRRKGTTIPYEIRAVDLLWSLVLRVSRFGALLD